MAGALRARILQSGKQLSWSNECDAFVGVSDGLSGTSTQVYRPGMRLHPKTKPNPEKSFITTLTSFLHAMPCEFGLFRNRLYLHIIAGA